MAKIKNKVIGDFAGMLGDIIFRDYKGTSIASMRPKNFPVSNSPSIVSRRARFSMAAKLSKAIRFSNEVKISWTLVTPSNLTTHSYMVQVNYPFVSDVSVSDLFRITPEKNFIASFSDFNLRDYELQATIKGLTESSGINISVEKNIKLFTVFFLTSPTNPELAPYSFISLESGVRTLNLNEDLDFVIPLSDIDNQVLRLEYQIRKSYSIAITLSETGIPIKYSDKIINTV